MGRPTFKHVKVIYRSNLLNQASYERDKGEDFTKRLNYRKSWHLYLKCHVSPPHPPFKMNLLVVAKLFFINVVVVCWKMGFMRLLPTWW